MVLVAHSKDSTVLDVEISRVKMVENAAVLVLFDSRKVSFHFFCIGSKHDSLTDTLTVALRNVRLADRIIRGLFVNTMQKRRRGCGLLSVCVEVVDRA